MHNELVIWKIQDRVFHITFGTRLILKWVNGSGVATQTN